MIKVCIRFHVLSERQDGLCAMFALTIVGMWYFCCIPVYLPVIIQNHFPTSLITSCQTSKLQRNLLQSPQRSLALYYVSSGFLFTPLFLIE